MKFNGFINFGKVRFIKTISLIDKRKKMGVLEMIMLIGFGISWPFSIYRSYKNKSVKGKSVIFLFCILVGYAAGILHKIFEDYNWVLFFYLLNFSMVSFDTLIYFKYRKNS